MNLQALGMLFSTELSMFDEHAACKAELSISMMYADLARPYNTTRARILTGSQRVDALITIIAMCLPRLLISQTRRTRRDIDLVRVISTFLRRT